MIEAAAAATDQGSAHLYATMSEPKNATIVSAQAVADPAVATITAVARWTPAAIAREFGRLDFIKIDAEGAEEGIIAGLRPLLAEHRPQLVLEFNAARYPDARGFLAEVMSGYDALRYVDGDGALVPIAAEAVLTEDVGEDRLLFLSGGSRMRRGGSTCGALF